MTVTPTAPPDETSVGPSASPAAAAGKRPRILCINAAGPGDLHGVRMRQLAARLPWADTVCHDFAKADRANGAKELSALLASAPWDLAYMESTGIGAGMTLIGAARRRGLRYVVSSGDPVYGFFAVTKGRAFAAPFGLYERELYRRSVGFIGWTPYLTGRALELGAPRGVTIEGGAALEVFRPYSPEERRAARARFGVPADHLVCGIVGSLKWVPRQNYSYGLELVETIKRVRRPDVTMLVVGDGDGRAELERRVPAELKGRVIFTGRLAEADVVPAMNAMDIGFIAQTLDELGSYRLTTKMPEYLACGLPVAMSPVPGFFDYIGPAGWPLPGLHPADPAFHARCAEWIDSLGRAEIEERRAACRAIAESRFAYEIIGARFERFVRSLVAA